MLHHRNCPRSKNILGDSMLNEPRSIACLASHIHPGCRCIGLSAPCLSQRLLRQGLPEPLALRCHFEPLTGEVCIAGADGPDGGSLAGLKDGKGAPALTLPLHLA